VAAVDIGYQLLKQGSRGALHIFDVIFNTGTEDSCGLDIWIEKEKQ
jgi:hypothetical protein